VPDPLHDLVRAGRLRRSELTGRFLYTSALRVSPDELKTAILLFYSLLDEQQRRLFAGLESIKLGHSGAYCGLNSLAWIPIPSPAVVTNCSIRM